MALFVLAYPQLATADLNWIQAIRVAHDPHYELVKPHFTLVFGVADVASTLFIDHVKLVAADCFSFQFALRCATIVKDSFSSLTHTFLVPDEGHSELVRLHDRLYTGVLSPTLRLDVPFIPHITIAAKEDAWASKKLVDALNQEQLCMHGRVEQLTIVNLIQGQLETFATVSLKL